MKKLFVLILAFLPGCTDATWDSTIGKLGVAAEIECYSGGQLVFKDKSTGAITSPQASDGWAYRSEENGKYREVSADCILTYED